MDWEVFMTKYQESILEDITVLSVKVVGVKNSAQAFNKLESTLPTLKGRKFYGCLSGTPETGIYRACVAGVESDNPEGLETWTIPGGKYLRAKIEDWVGKENMIGEVFSDMAKISNVDYDRPYIEYYRSQKELILLLPVKFV